MQVAREVGLRRVIKYISFVIWQRIFNLLPFSPLKVSWLRFGGARIGNNTIIDNIDFINLDRTGLNGLRVGSNCFIGRDSQLDMAGKITLENFTTISPRAIILSHVTVGLTGHPLLKPYPPKVGHTKLKRGSFVGAGSVILAGTVVDTNSLVGAGSVVTKDVPPSYVVAGNPARKIKTIRK